MKAKTEPALQRLQTQMRRAQELMDQAEHEQACELYQQVREDARALGVYSAHLAWCLAVAADHAGDVHMAVDSIQEALERDPLSQPFLRSLDIIVNRVRRLLQDPQRAPDAVDTPKLYALLQRTGGVDAASHVVMARHLAAVSRPEEALKLLDAVTQLSPFEDAAWREKAQVARQLGHLQIAHEAELECALLRATGLASDGLSAPFLIPPEQRN